MSKQNKVNPGKYTQAGRLSQDDAARERMKQIDTPSTRRLDGHPPEELKATPSGQSEADGENDELAERAQGDEQTDDTKR
jgi:hypothetical protein